MRKWIVRALSLYVFDVVVLLLIGLFIPSVRVGLWNSLWAAVVLTLATLLIKPALLRAFQGGAAKSASQRTKTGEKLVQYAIVFIVQLIIWVLTVLLTGVHVQGWFWGYVLPTILLLVAWVIYDLIDDRVEAKTDEIVGSVQARMSGAAQPAASDAGAASPADANAAAKQEAADGLTPEQRRMLDEL